MAIYKHEGKWQVRVRHKGHPQQTRSFQYMGDAEAWEREILGEMDRDVFVSRSEAEKTTLAELLQRYIDECVPKLADPQWERNRVKALMARELSRPYAAPTSPNSYARGKPKASEETRYGSTSPRSRRSSTSLGPHGASST